VRLRLPDVDPYTVLGITPSASTDEVKRAYRALARTLHPDVNPTGEEEFKQVTVAYTLLSDPVERARYDESAGQALWQQLFTTATDGSTGSSAAADGPDAAGRDRAGVLLGPGRVQIRLTFTEAARGAEGPFLAGGHRYTVTVPAGTRDGATLPADATGTSVTCRVSGHPYFSLDDDTNVHIRVPVTTAELAAGADIRVPALSPAPVRVRIPAGTLAGAVLRARGRGIIVHGTRASDLLVSFTVVDPDPDPGEHATVPGTRGTRTAYRRPAGPPSAAAQRATLLKKVRATP